MECPYTQHTRRQSRASTATWKDRLTECDRVTPCPQVQTLAQVTTWSALQHASKGFASLPLHFLRFATKGTCKEDVTSANPPSRNKAPSHDTEPRNLPMRERPHCLLTSGCCCERPPGPADASTTCSRCVSAARAWSLLLAFFSTLYMWARSLSSISPISCTRTDSSLGLLRLSARAAEAATSRAACKQIQKESSEDNVALGRLIPSTLPGGGGGELRFSGGLPALLNPS